MLPKIAYFIIRDLIEKLVNKEERDYIFNMELADYEAKYILGGKGGR